MYKDLPTRNPVAPWMLNEIQRSVHVSGNYHGWYTSFSSWDSRFENIWFLKSHLFFILLLNQFQIYFFHSEKQRAWLDHWQFVRTFLTENKPLGCFELVLLQQRANVCFFMILLSLQQLSFFHTWTEIHWFGLDYGKYINIRRNST